MEKDSQTSAIATRTSAAANPETLKFKKILDHLLDVVCTATENGEFVSVHGACESRWGYKPEELVGRSFSELVCEEDRAKTLEIIQHLVAGQAITNFENCYRHKNGKKVSIHWSATWDEETRLIYAIARDITERKIAEEQVIKEKDLSDSIINSLPGVFYLYDSSGKFIRWNKNFETVTGYSGEEISRMHPLDFFEGEEKTLLQQRIGAVFETGESSVEANFINRKKERIPYYFTGVLINYEDKPCLIGAGIDIRERKKAEAELTATNEQLRSLSSYLQRVREEERINIAREIHDELGQQLTGLKMDMYWLNKKIASEDPSIDEKIKGITALIDETVKSVRRISSNLRPSILDDLGLLAALEWHSEEVEKRAQIKVNFETNMTDKDLPVAIATGIFRIYQEALTNAVRHSNAKEINSSLILIGDELVLKIKDNGIGMDLTTPSRSRSFGLLGIKERTFALGGKFDLKSAPGQGTQVCVSIPVTRQLRH